MRPSSSNCLCREKENRRVPTTDQRRIPPTKPPFQNHRIRHVQTKLWDRNQNFHISRKDETILARTPPRMNDVVLTDDYEKNHAWRRPYSCQGRKPNYYISMGGPTDNFNLQRETVCAQNRPTPQTPDQTPVPGSPNPPRPNRTAGPESKFPHLPQSNDSQKITSDE